jgi:hypothetical protein
MSGKPAFLYCDYADAATVTATDSLAGTSPTNVLYATEDTVWSPANATGVKNIVIDLSAASSANSSTFLGVNLNGLSVQVFASSDNFAADSDTLSGVVVLSAQGNVAFLPHTATVKRYIKYSISNPTTALQIAHICPDTLVEQPWLDKDPIAEDLSPTFNNLVSSGGLFLGNNQVNTMRAIEIDFGEVTDSEYTSQIEPWVDACIKVASPFYFLPDSTNTVEIYFCWLEDNEGFRAPLVNGNRTVSAVAAKTRLV